MRNPYSDNSTPYHDDWATPNSVEYNKTGELLDYLNMRSFTEGEIGTIMNEIMGILEERGVFQPKQTIDYGRHTLDIDNLFTPPRHAPLSESMTTDAYMQRYLESKEKGEDWRPELLHAEFTPPPRVMGDYSHRQGNAPAMGPTPFHPDQLHELQYIRGEGGPGKEWIRNFLLPELGSIDAFRNNLGSKGGSYESKMIDADIATPPPLKRPEWPRSYFDPLIHTEERFKAEKRILELPELIKESSEPAKLMDLLDKVIYDQLWKNRDEITEGHRVTTLAGTGSMKPEFEGGDIVIYKTHEYGDLEVGDIVLFRPNYTHGYDAGPHVDPSWVEIFHRIVEITPEGEFITRGDNTSMNDPGSRLLDDITAKYEFSIPLSKSPFIGKTFDLEAERADENSRYRKELEYLLGNRLYHPY